MKKEQLLGDLTAEKMKQLRLDRVAKKITKKSDEGCGCAERQESLNNLHKKFKEMVNGKKCKNSRTKKN